MCKKIGSEPSSPYSNNLPEVAPAAQSPASTAGEAPAVQANAQLDLWLRLSFSFQLGGPAQCPANLPPSGCVPPPSADQACAPEGKGLTKNADGSVTTAGGYRIKALGSKAAWSIHGPDGKLLTKVSGDPHVFEKDGTRWDFTKNSNFVLPDGTRIGVKTGGGRGGQTVTESLDIVNGSERVKIDGIRANKPVTGEVTHDGLTGWNAENGTGRDTFSLTHDDKKQNWVKYNANGDLKGVVTGAKQSKPNGAYQQITNGRESRLTQTPVAATNTQPSTQQELGMDPWSSWLGQGVGGVAPSPYGGYFSDPQSAFQAFEVMRSMILRSLSQYAQLDAGVNAWAHVRL